MKFQNSIQGCLLGTAVGDAIGLPYEGMRPGRIAKLTRNEALRHRFLFGRGMVSDDTDHSMFVAQALIQFPDDSEKFAQCLAGYLKRWLLCLPAGIGLATLKSLLKLWLGLKKGDCLLVRPASNGGSARRDGAQRSQGASLI